MTNNNDPRMIARLIIATLPDEFPTNLADNDTSLDDFLDELTRIPFAEYSLCDFATDLDNDDFPTASESATSPTFTDASPLLALIDSLALMIPLTNRSDIRDAYLARFASN